MEQYRHTFCNLLQDNIQGEGDEKTHLLGSHLPEDSVGNSTTISNESGGGDNTLYKEITFPLQFRLYDYHQKTVLNQGTYNGPTGFLAETDTKNNENSQGINIDLLQYVQRGLHDVTASILSEQTQVKGSHSSSSFSSLQWVWTTNKESQPYPCNTKANPCLRNHRYLLPNVQSSKPSKDNASWSLSTAPYQGNSQGFMVNMPHTKAMKDINVSQLFWAQRTLKKCPFSSSPLFLLAGHRIRWGSNNPKKSWSKILHPHPWGPFSYSAAGMLDFTNVYVNSKLPLKFSQYEAAERHCKECAQYSAYTRHVKNICFHQINSKWWRMDFDNTAPSNCMWGPCLHFQFKILYINPSDKKMLFSNKDWNPDEEKTTEETVDHTAVLDYEHGNVKKKNTGGIGKYWEFA